VAEAYQDFDVQKRFSQEINAFTDMVFSEIDLGDADTWQVKVSASYKVYCGIDTASWSRNSAKLGINLEEITQKSFQLYLVRMYRLAFVLFLSSAIQIILEIYLVAIIVLCSDVTTIELFLPVYLNW